MMELARAPFTVSWNEFFRACHAQPYFSARIYVSFHFSFNIEWQDSPVPLYEPIVAFL